VGPRTGLDEVERRRILPLPGLELRPLCPPVAIPTALSRLRSGDMMKLIKVSLNLRLALIQISLRLTELRIGYTPRVLLN
jgi:hypothetical protein